MSVSLPPHNILSPFHLDTLTDTVVRGDLLYGNSTPKWARLAKPSVLSGLSHDGTDVSWVTATGTGAPVRAGAPTLTGVPVLANPTATTLIVGGTTNPFNRVATFIGTLGISVVTSAADDSGFIIRSQAGIGLLAASFDSTGSYKPLGFSTSGVTRLLVDTTGNIGIGAGTFSAAALPNELLEVASAAGSRIIFSDGGGANRKYLFFQSPGSLHAYARMLAFDNSGAGTALDLAVQEFGGNTCFGSATIPSARLSTLSTTEQFRILYNATNYAPFTVSSVGSLTIAPIGTNPSITLTPSGSGIVSLNGHLSLEGVTSTGATGTGKIVFDTSPSLVTPALGTPASGVLTNCTGIPAAGITGTLPVANGGTGVTSSTGTVAVVLSTSPTLVTPVLGVAGGTSLTLSGLLSVDSPTLVVDATNHFVGFGTSAPVKVVHAVAQVSGVNITQDTFVNSASGAGFTGRKARGTLATPLRAKTNDVLSGIAGQGAEAVDDVTPATFPATVGGQFRYFAAEDFTSTAHGSYFTLQLAPIGSTTITQRMRIDDTGVLFAGPLALIGGVITAGAVGAPAVVATGRATAQVAANASVSTFTVGAADASFEVSANVLVTTATICNFTVTVAYTDEGGTSRTLTLQFSTLAGAFVSAIVNTGGASPYEGVPLHLRCQAATSITIATTGTFTTVAYNVEGIIKQMA